MWKPIFLSFAMLAASVSAEPLLVTASGVFGSFSQYFTPTTGFTAPNATWALSFQVESDPAVSDTSFGVQFAPVFSNFTYILNGAPIALSPAEILFNATSFNGLFNVCLDSACITHQEGLRLDGSQLYTGSELSPTIVPGNYVTTQLFIGVNNTSFLEPNATVVVSAIPEPTTLWLVGAGLLLLGPAAHRRSFS
jgi:hypothetical protein